MTDLESVAGVGPAAAKKLREVFVTTAELLAVQNPAELQDKTKLGEGTIAKIIRNARMQCGKFGFKSGLDVEHEMETMARLTSGLPSLDEALLGGIEAGSIIEFYGPARGGKTQWCALMAVRAQLPVEEGGLGGRVLWLDSESSFKPWVIRANALRFGMDPDITLGNIGRAEIFLSGQINEIFETIPQMCAEQNYKFVVLDSFTGLFRAEYTGLDKLKLRQQHMNSVLNQMRRTAAATEATFAYTNQAMANISLYGGNPNAPVGGHILSHASDYRFYVKRRMKDERMISLQDNAGVPEFEIKVNVGWGGFYENSKDKKDSESGILESLKKSGKAGFGEALAEVDGESPDDESLEEVEVEAT
ncbi:MAG: AAA family ATPase, partial [Candidatus Thorarchaeota archaeon]|nr:AAA family ATPase [Candidatus Thorarchaeota archaeon]